MQSTITKHTEDPSPLYIVRESAKVVMLKSLCEQQLFSVIYDRYYDKVMDLVRIMDRSSIHSREDIAQDIFLKLWEKKEVISQIHSLDNYLFFMVKNRLINERGKKERVKKYRSYAAEHFSDVTPDEIIFRETERNYKAAVSALPPRARQTYLLKNQGQLKIPAIAKSMRISQSVVKQHLAGAQKKIREKMRPFRAD